jgi:hypothetical protein
MFAVQTSRRIFLAAKVLLPWIGILVGATALAVLPAHGEMLTLSGTGQTLVQSGAKPVYHTVSARADFTITGNTLTLVLANTSAANSTDPADALSSFYFDIVRNGLRPTLSYASADGPLYLLKKSAPDERYYYRPAPKVGVTGTFIKGPGISDLRALKDGDQTWQLRQANPTPSQTDSKGPLKPTLPPGMGFGIGTVGNSGFSPNGFDPAWVGKGNTMINFSIVRAAGFADLKPNGTLIGGYLLENSGTFTFTGIDGWSLKDIRHECTFGFGTSPDGVIAVVPEPSAAVLGAVGAGLAAMSQAAKRRRKAAAEASARPHDGAAEEGPS